MRAMVLERIVSLDETSEPLTYKEIPVPEPKRGEVLIKVLACGVCHTELDEIEGRTPPQTPMILGHQVVGRIEAVGEGAEKLRIGDRVGVAWIYSACGKCKYCRSGRENLCPEFQATGRDSPGGYAEYMVAKEDFTYPIPDVFSETEAAPLLCAGAIGYRSLRLAGIKDGDNLGLTGFGASGHLVLKIVRHKFPKSDVYVFARSEKERQFALQLGAVWAGGTADPSPAPLRSIIDTTPVWKPVVEALKNLEPGGRLIINAIRKEEVDKDYLTHLDYPRDLWLSLIHI